MADPIDPKDLTKLAFTLYSYIYPAGEHSVDSEPLFERIQRIRRGLNPENEFSAMVSWLGKCPAINRIDQTPMPIKDREMCFQAPDFIAFPIYKKEIVPVLIEVKTSNKDKLVWSESYYKSLKHYAEALKLPLLIAWKTKFMWVVVDHVHFQKKVTSYHLDLQTAIKENLFALLFGNVLIHPNENISFVLDADIISPEPETRLEILPEGDYQFKIKGYNYYLDKEIIDKDKVLPACVSLMFTIGTDNAVETLSSNKVKIIFRPIPDNGIQLVDLLLTTLYLQSKDEESIEWDKVLREGPFGTSGMEYRIEFIKPEARPFISRMILQNPLTIPPYLADIDSKE